MTHPKEALFESGKSLPIIPTCEHFAGSEKLILKGFEMQKKLGPVFDITCDCEDGKYLPNVVLDLDYTVVIPKKVTKK